MTIREIRGHSRIRGLFFPRLLSSKHQHSSNGAWNLRQQQNLWLRPWPSLRFRTLML